MTQTPGAHQSIALVTGAYGGMGRACARLLGLRHRLALCDVDAARMTSLAEDFRNEGYDIAVAQACDVSNPQAVAHLAGAIEAQGRIGAVAHTAGLSPALGSWRPILEVNLVGSALLLDAIADLLNPGAGVVLIASMAAYTSPREAEIDALIDDPLADGFMARIEPHVKRLSDGTERNTALTAYKFSKRGVIRMSERYALKWGKKGARVTTVSPGQISTPMGLKEASVDNKVQWLVDQTPIPRWGTALDIANAVNFLASDAASFITGCDLRVDGGITPIALTRPGSPAPS